MGGTSFPPPLQLCGEQDSLFSAIGLGCPEAWQLEPKWRNILLLPSFGAGKVAGKQTDAHNPNTHAHEPGDVHSQGLAGELDQTTSKLFF